jgi:hypothetical protein
MTDGRLWLYNCARNEQQDSNVVALYARIVGGGSTEVTSPEWNDSSVTA